jgi:hypothetical protein
LFTLFSGLGITVVLAMRRQYKAILILILVAIPLGWFLTLFSVVRSYMHQPGHQGVSGAVAGIVEGYNRAVSGSYGEYGTVSFIYGITEATDLSLGFYVMRDFPQVHDYFYGAFVGKSFIFWIPRAIWPGKPKSASTVLAHYYAPKAKEGLSLQSTILGEMYADFGLFSLAAIPLFFLLFGLLLRKLISEKSVQVIMGVVLGFAMCRGGISTFFVFFLLAVLMLKVSRLLFARYSNRARRLPEEEVLYDPSSYDSW